MNTASLPVSVGIIGYGSMGSALAKAIARIEPACGRFSLCVLARSNRKAAAEAARDIVFVDSLQELVDRASLVVIAVMPEDVEQLTRDIVACLPADAQPRDKMLISVAAGVPLALLSSIAGEKLAVARVMPNTLVEVGRGLFGVCLTPEVAVEQKDRIDSLFGGLGKVVHVPEEAMNAFTSLAGCGPGFLFHIMDGLCEAGVSVGLSRENSRIIAVELMGGCARLAEVTGKHPVILREQGTSPAGMTIAGLNLLDRTGVRGHLIEAVKTARDQGKVMDTQ